MNNPPNSPTIKLGGSAFCGNTTQAHRPIGQLPQGNKLAVAKLARWCQGNFISLDIGYSLIKKGYLIGFRRHGCWWVRANPDCLEQLLEYIGLEELLFQAPNG